MSVPVSVVLDRKGHEVLTTSADATVADVTAVMVEHGVGALVVTDGSDAVQGIVSERDVLHGLATHGAELLGRKVADVMTSAVQTCAPNTGTTELAEMMTESRIRHLPVVDDGRLVGIVSIGDVVKSRIDELATQAESLEAYVSGTSY
jgi:CBS domain-containing protein